VPPEHPLAGLWNDPEFARRLWGSYGFLSEREPRLTPEEQTLYRDSILPLLREDPEKAVPALEAAVKPEASALFDYTLGTVHFQRGDFTNAVRHYESALAKFPDFLRAQRNLALALVRDEGDCRRRGAHARVPGVGQIELPEVAPVVTPHDRGDPDAAVHPHRGRLVSGRR
jgi:tetratricopeptide (TPR) repeat protein